MSSPKVIQAIQASLAAHRTAIEFYTGVAEEYRRWGYPGLAEHFDGEASDERVHQARLIARLEYYEEVPGFDHEAPEWPHHDVIGMILAALTLEEGAASLERKGVLVAREVGDEGTAEVFRLNLFGSEDSVRELTAWQRTIDQVTVENWLSNYTQGQA